MKKIIIQLIVYLFLCQSCEVMTCKDLVNEYRQASFKIKLDKIYNKGTRHYTLEGRDNNNRNYKWTDFSNWILDIKHHISIGDSIIKEKGVPYIIIKKQNDTTEYKYFVECEGHEYQK